MTPALIAAARGRFTALIADRGYDSNTIRAAVQAQSVAVVIPPTRSRDMKLHYSRATYRARILVQRVWCRLKE